MDGRATSRRPECGCFILSRRKGPRTLSATSRVLIPAASSVRCQEHRRIECVLVSRRKIERDDLLALVLSQLIETVWRLEPIASDQDVEVKCILAARCVVKSVERIAIVPDCMNRIELRRVQKRPDLRPLERR